MVTRITTAILIITATITVRTAAGMAGDMAGTTPGTMIPGITIPGTMDTVGTAPTIIPTIGTEAIIIGAAVQVPKSTAQVAVPLAKVFSEAAVWAAGEWVYRPAQAVTLPEGHTPAVLLQRAVLRPVQV